ncbi:hypothetical protein LTR53_003333 [Teratosphaeriaceae sp. CCFEE 6253]|nr:hypothetical protein LTR53_003333 [Teratosphaeriaceae sp. CCFEE 6253]
MAWRDDDPASGRFVFPGFTSASKISISLTPNSSVADQRSIDLSSTQPVTIGRASRSEVREELLARNYNALFDCPVISRQHARLHYRPEQPRDQQITVTDLDSMHGTFVDGVKLLPGEPYVLRHGNKIQLGDRVVRGMGKRRQRGASPRIGSLMRSTLETHNGIILTFDRQEDVPVSQTQPTCSNTFVAPDVTSEDESDNASDAGSAAEKKVSSADTTPEMTRPLLGSKQSPIEVEEATTSSVKDVIDLVHDDRSSASQAAPKTNPWGERRWSSLISQALKPIMTRTVVGAGEASPPAAAKPATLVVKDTYDEAGSEAESSRSRVVPATAVDDDEEDLVSGSSDNDAPASDQDDAEDLSDSDASDLSGCDGDSVVASEDEEDEDDDDDEEGPDEMTSNRQQSPELGECVPLKSQQSPELGKVRDARAKMHEMLQHATSAQAGPPDTNTHEWSRHLDSYPRPSVGRYDPVRSLGYATSHIASSQPPPPPPSRAPYPSSFAHAASFTARPPPPPEPFGSNRWDTQSGRSTSNYMSLHGPSPYSANEFVAAQSQLGPYTYQPAPNQHTLNHTSGFTTSDQLGFSSMNGAVGWDTVYPHHAASAPRHTEGSSYPMNGVATQSKSHEHLIGVPAIESGKSKMTIPALVEQPAAKMELLNTTKGPDATPAAAGAERTRPLVSNSVTSRSHLTALPPPTYPSTGPATAAGPLSTPATAAGSKRKADEFTNDSDFTHLDPLSDAGTRSLAELFASLNTPVAEGGVVASTPPVKKMRVVKEVAKYGFAAGVGGLGTAAFLASPYAQQLLDWMA